MRIDALDANDVCVFALFDAPALPPVDTIICTENFGFRGCVTYWKVLDHFWYTRRVEDFLEDWHDELEMRMHVSPVDTSATSHFAGGQ